MNPSNSVNIYMERIHRAVDYISENLSEEISLGKLADVACFSPFHFHRIFSAMLGETPHNYIERLRMEHAANEICIRRDANLFEILMIADSKPYPPFQGRLKNFMESHHLFSCKNTRKTITQLT